MTPAEARALFPITATRAYMFAGGLTPAASTVKAELDRWSDRWAMDAIGIYDEYPTEWEKARQGFAAIIGAQSDEIAITDHTSRASNLAVQMIEAPAGSNVVVDDTTYPSSLYPWMLPAKRHVEMRRVPSHDNVTHLDDLSKAVDDRTVAVTISHVSPMTGFRHDLAKVAEIAHAKGAYLLVDAAQSAGALDIDVRRDGVDFLSCLAMKWLCGMPGVGFLYVARELANRMTPGQVGYAGTRRAFEPGAPLDFVDGNLRNELGIPALPGLAASRAGVDILLAVGTKTIEPHVLDLSGRCVDGLLKRGLKLFTRPEPEYRAGVIAFRINPVEELTAYQRARGVDVWGESGMRIFRVDPHVYNNHDDVDRFLDAMDGYLEMHGRAGLQD